MLLSLIFSEGRSEICTELVEGKYESITETKIKAHFVCAKVYGADALQKAGGKELD